MSSDLFNSLFLKNNQFKIKYAENTYPIDWNQLKNSHLNFFFELYNDSKFTTNNNNKKRPKQVIKNIRCCDMSGASYTFPLDKWSEFFQVLKKDVDEKNDFFIDQRVYFEESSAVLFFELDIRDDKINEQKELYIKEIWNKVTKFFKNPSEMIVLFCKEKPKKKDKNWIKANGVHLIFPYYAVTRSEMVQIYYSVKLYFDELKFPKDIIDSQVIKSDMTCLRLPYSKKIVDCYVCNGKDNLDCVICNPNKKTICNSRVVDPSFYYPVYKIDSEGNKIPYLETDLSLLSIAPIQDRQYISYIFPNNEVTYIETENTKRKEMNIRKSTEVEDTQLNRLILSCIKNINPSYADVVIERVYKNVKNYIITLNGKSSRYCLLKKDFHNSNRVYFKFYVKKNVTYIAFGCYDEECKNKLKDQLCSDRYTWPIENNLSVILFNNNNFTKETKQTKTVDFLLDILNKKQKLYD
jgi:hypothetical protein